MNVDSRDGRGGFSSEQLRQQLRALSAVQPPHGLKERLTAAISCQMGSHTTAWHLRRWPGATGWVGLAAAIMVLCGVIWLRTPAGRSVGPAPDMNSSPGRVLAADYNSVRPPDINALDSNGLN